MIKRLSFSLGILCVIFILSLSACDGDLPEDEPPTPVPGETSIGCDVDQLIIALENPDPNGVTINLADCQYVFESSYSGQYGSKSALPTITSPVTIIGSDGTAFLRSDNPGTEEFRFFDIYINGDLTVKNLIFINGNLSSWHQTDQGGGAVMNNAGTFTCEQCDFQHNSAYFGGAYFRLSPKGYDTFDDCEFYRNSANRGGAVYLHGDTIFNNTFFIENMAWRGGGLYSWHGLPRFSGTCIFENNDASISGGAAYLFSHTPSFFNDLIIHHNHANVDGGGIYIHGNECYINGCNINNNSAGNDVIGKGGGVYLNPIDRNANHKLLINSSTLELNSAGKEGGAIYSKGDVYVKDSMIGNNSAAFGGGIFTDSVYVSIYQTHLDRNSASEKGGAIFNLQSQNSISFSTLFNNMSGDSGAAIHGGGGSIINSTISSNQSEAGSILYAVKNSSIYFGTITENISGAGSAALRFSPSQNDDWNISIKESIIINNQDAGGNTRNCNLSNYSIEGINWQDDSSCPDFTIQLPSDLDPLANNGGPTQTHSFPYTSPARNSASSCLFYNTDQRGITRPQGSQCDIGAYEYEEIISTPPMVTFLETANCRLRPDSSYLAMTSFKKFEKAEVVGRNINHTWYEVVSSEVEDPCWVWVEQVEFEGNIEDIPVRAPEVTETVEEQSEETSEEEEQEDSHIPPTLKKHF